MSRGLFALSIALCLTALAPGEARAHNSFSPSPEWQQSQDPPPVPSPDQQLVPAVQDPSQPPAPSANAGDAAPASRVDSPQPKIEPALSGQQTKRILWIMPNYRSVSANTYLPPQRFEEKFWLATEESFDYSAFIWNGMMAGMAMGSKSQPSFGQGASGFGYYYSYAVADGTIENYLVEALVPTITREDPRYYTLGKGGFFKRSGYALSRLVVTRTDAGHHSLNLSEVVGAGAAAGIGNAYYPTTSNMWVKTYQRWGSQMLQDATSNLFKEFWPDVNRALFHNKY